MRSLLTGLVLLGVVAAGTAHANRWDQRQPLFAERGERRPLLQRRQEQMQQQTPAARDQPGNPASPTPAVQTPAVASTKSALQPAEAGRRAQQQYGGRVLSVSPTDGGYHVRLLNNGEVSSVIVPNQ